MAKKKCKRRPSTYQERQAAIREIRKRLQDEKPQPRKREFWLVMTGQQVVTGAGAVVNPAYVFWNQADAASHVEYRNRVFRESCEAVKVREAK